MMIDEIIAGLSSLTDTNRMLRKSLEMIMIEELLGRDRRMTWDRQHPYGMVTTSLDHARDLFQEALPGWLYRVMECSLSDDAWVTPDFNHPEHGAELQMRFPDAMRDPLEWFGTDISLSPSGRPALALCVSMLIAKKKINEQTAQTGVEATPPERFFEMNDFQFGDIIENGWASDSNPTKRGVFLYYKTRTGRLNPGRHAVIRFKSGGLGEFRIDNEAELTKIGTIFDADRQRLAVLLSAAASAERFIASVAAERDAAPDTLEQLRSAIAEAEGGNN
ncbi:hypothetical protein GR212_15505 [Rhizobium lusitanum]|uniref:Uncharacterized protein n=1 Tax=Rhizobium lusitanum TaxID=293958 RepID=A0A6L9U9M0_9HYPH|nr:hypothetical protein [Rhizobium lusitanum]NEI70986.1 hypothetical protein [Rhizobium lusitanum]